MIFRYLQKTWKYCLLAIFCCLSYHLYFLFLLPKTEYVYLLYLDLLIGCLLLICFCINYHVFSKRESLIESMLESDTLITRQLSDTLYAGAAEDDALFSKRAAEHDLRILEERLAEQFAEKCDLQDYITKWCHELKTPLAGSLLIVEKRCADNSEGDAPDSMLTLQKQLERINILLRNVLLGCRLQSQLFDIQIRKTSLSECVRTSLHNNQFFLVHRHFDLQLDLAEATVYTDKTWLVYVLDQLIDNAVKYCTGQNTLLLKSRQDNNGVSLSIRDSGEGIQAKDLNRIFEKGYTGSSHHNGKYKSTGMGLYMVQKILKKLEHTVEVESVPDSYTQFTIRFTDQRGYFLQDDA